MVLAIDNKGAGNHIVYAVSDTSDPMADGPDGDRQAVHRDAPDPGGRHPVHRLPADWVQRRRPRYLVQHVRPDGQPGPGRLRLPAARPGDNRQVHDPGRQSRYARGQHHHPAEDPDFTLVAGRHPHGRAPATPCGSSPARPTATTSAWFACPTCWTPPRRSPTSWWTWTTTPTRSPPRSRAGPRSTPATSACSAWPSAAIGWWPLTPSGLDFNNCGPGPTRDVRPLVRVRGHDAGDPNGQAAGERGPGVRDQHLFPVHRDRPERGHRADVHAVVGHRVRVDVRDRTEAWGRPRA